MVELLVVVAIATIMLLIAVPAFKSLTYSTRRASAENALKGGLRTARLIAIGAGEGRDVAAVFIHEPGGRITIVPCVLVGEFLETRLGRRVKVFAPVSGVDAVQLPPGWSVRAYAPPNSIVDGNDSEGWYSSRNYPISQGNWIFPETGFYDISLPGDGDNRQTFMVRFRGGSGELDLSHPEPVLVLDVAPTNSFRSQQPWRDYRADTAIDLVRFVRRVLGDDVTFVGNLGQEYRQNLLGNEATDTVLARAVGQLAVYNERRLAAGVGARRLNRDTETLYMGLEDPNNPNKEPRLDLSLFPAGATIQSVSEAVSDWLESRVASSEAMVFTIQRYSGRAQEMLPLEPAGGQP
ncbi:MAG: hypothetical protein IID31_10390 [Planctomycetes bacterium]|nr:hypothetical protein [Planctomycetota bacterium]